jgi:hypothetical protein
LSGNAQRGEGFIVDGTRLREEMKKEEEDEEGRR